MRGIWGKYTLAGATFMRIARVVVGQTMKSLTAILSVCSTPAVITPTELDGILLTNGNSVQAVFSYCSGGKFHFDTYIYPEIINIPCPDSITLCNTDNWANYADTVLKSKMINIEEYTNSIYVLPSGCGFGGLGVVGPCNYQRCRVWINGGVSRQSSTYVHEIGHNLGLNHAGYNGDAYGDWSSAMGYCCQSRCYSAPHIDDLKWKLPKAEYETIQLSIPITIELKGNEYIKVTVKSMMMEYFIQYRVSSGLDMPPSGFRDLVFLYSSGVGSTFSNLEGILRTPGDGLLVAASFKVGLTGLDGKTAKIVLSV